MIVSKGKNARVARFGRAKLVASLTGAVLVIGSGAVQADPNVETRTMTVSYADLNLATPAGVEALHRRIQSAARTLCGPQHERQLDVRRDARNCYNAAVSDAVAAMDRNARLARLQVHRQ